MHGCPNRRRSSVPRSSCASRTSLSPAELLASLSHFVDVAIPLPPLPQATSQPPAQCRRLPVDACPDAMQPLADDAPVIGIQHIIAVGKFVELGEIGGGRPPQSPIGLAAPREMIGIKTRMIEVGELMLADEHQAVDDVLLVDPGDLHLLEQEIAERDGWIVELETPPEVDLMRELQHVVENVEMPFLQ